jgi:hypothetical protein
MATLKRAVTVVLLVTVTEQEPLPEQPPPLHPANVEPSAAGALKETVTPS